MLFLLLVDQAISLQFQEPHPPQPRMLRSSVIQGTS